MRISEKLISPQTHLYLIDTEYSTSASPPLVVFTTDKDYELKEKLIAEYERRTKREHSPKFDNQATLS
jgi:hypothetical protein